MSFSILSMFAETGGRVGWNWHDTAPCFCECYGTVMIVVKNHLLIAMKYEFLKKVKVYGMQM